MSFGSLPTVMIVQRNSMMYIYGGVIERTFDASCEIRHICLLTAVSLVKVGS